MADNTTTQNITLSVPEAGITRDIEITPGDTLTFDFNPKLVQYELSEDGDLILTFKNGGGYTFKGFAELDGDVNVSVNGLVVSMADFLINVADIETAAGGEKSLTSGQQGYEEGFGSTLEGIDNLTLTGDALTTPIDSSGSDLPDQQAFDVTAPEIGPVDLTTPSDSGTFSNDNLTNIAAPVFTGTSEAGSVITIFANGSPIGTTTTDDNGNWEFQAPTLEEGLYDITATSTDDSGNTSDPTPPLSIEIDLTTPVTPDITFTDNQDDIPAYINAEEVTGDGTPTTTVNVRVPDGARAGDTLVVTYNDINGIDQTVATVLTTQQVTNGVNLEVEATGEFELTVNARAFDPAGNEGGTSTATILVDTIPPDAPNIDLQVDSRFDNDDYTNDGHLTFTGEADSTLSFTVVDESGNSIPTPTQTTLVNGEFTFDMDSLPDGTYTVVATLTDAAGNTSAPQTFSYTLDQTNPDLVTINETLPEISQDVPFDPSLGLFVEQLDAGEPNVTFEIIGGNDDGWFTLTPDGELSVTEAGINAGVMNFEQENLGDGRTITIKTTDQAGNTSESDYTLNVTNVNERPDAADFSYTSTVDANIGLRANFYAFDNQTDLPPGIRWTHRNAFDYVEAHISNSDTPADAAFIAGQLDFGLQRGTLDTFDELSNFIAGSGSQLVDTRPDDNFDTYADRGIIKLEGSAFFEGGEHRIRVYSDDGFQLKIDGEVVASFYNDRAPGTTTVNIGELTEGYHDIEIIYWDQGGRYALRVEDSVRPDGGTWSDFEVIGNNGGSPNTLAHNPLVTAEDNSLTIDTDLLLSEATDPDQGTTLALVNDSLELRATVNGVDMTGTDIIPPVTENGITYTNEISGVGKIGTDTDGNIVFTPAEDYNGEASFTYQVIDDGSPQLTSAPATVTLNVTPVNDAPEALDTASYDDGIEDQALVITRAELLNDLDIQDVEDGQNVLLDIAATNSNIKSITYDQNSEEFTIIPRENFNGDVTLRLSIEDQDGATTYRAINANFDSVNDIPTANLTADFDTGVEDQTLYITRADLISSLNIDDVEDGQNVILDLTTTNPNIQSITYDAVNEQYVIEPVENFNGDVQFNLSITDQEGASIQRTIGANFDPVNDVPTADLTTNFDTGVEDQTLYITRADLISSLNIDDVEDGQNVILDLTTANPNIQSITYDAVNEQYVIEPVENFNGDVQFNLSITDQEGASIQRTIGANFDPVNDVPTADLTTNFDTGVEDHTLYITRADLISSLNIDDVEDGQNVILDLTTTNPNIQSITYDAVNEQYVIEPVANFNGDVQFNLSITDQEGASIQRTIGATFDPVNDVPTADLTTNFDTGVEDQTLYITRADLISSLNISDVEDGQNVILDLTTTNPNIQSITYDAVNEQYVIEPVANFNGDVQFNLSITDQEGASIQRTIGATFDPVNDVPTADLTTNFDTGVEDQTLYITRADLISSLNIDDVEDGQNVILDLTTTNPNIQSITYDAVNEQYVIEPVENFNGDVQFNLSITDQEGASIQRTIGANFDPVNDVPTADLTTNFDTGVEDQTLYITRADLISNLNIDDVEDGQNVILDLTTANPNIQSITYDAVNEQYVIEPVENFNGDVQFNLSITDQEGASIQRTIGATFDPVNDVPTADLTTNFDTGVEDQTLYITRADLISSLNIDDVEDGQNVILDLTTANPNIQSITYDAVNEQYVIEPVENFNGNVQFNLSITDQEGASIQRTIGATFDPVNDVPTADLTTNFDTGVEDQTLYITRADLISSLNIDDVEDGQNVILDLTTANPNIQSITYDAVNEQYVIEPVENFNGDVQFNLSITDQEGASIQRTIGATFDPVNDVPTADLTTNFDTGVEDQTLYITRADLISSLNIDDVEDGQNVILDLTTANPNIQSITYDAVNEQYVIEPVENFNGDVQFNLSITDQEGASIQRTVGVNFDPRNDAPTGADAIIGVIDEDATVPVTFTAASLINDMSFEDIDGDNLTLTYTPNPVQAGVVTYEDTGGQTVVLQSGEEIDPTVTYSFTPAPNADTDFVFDVTATDPSGASVTEAATIDVLPINDAPILVFETPINTNPNIIVNGSFEDTDGVVISSGGWKGFNVLPGWTKTEFDGDGNPIDPRDQLEVHDEAHGNIGTADGENYMDLGASPGSSGRIGNVGMTQVIADGAIEEGQPYQLTFFIKNKAAAFNSNNADSADLRVVWNGLEVPIDLPDATGPDWVEVTVTVTADAGDNTLTFYETGEGGDNHGMAVDNISLVQVSTITAPVTISEDTPTDTVIAHAVASDVDSENLTFSFADGSLEQNGFVIDPISGEIKVAEGGPFNEAGEPFDVDAQGASDTITLDVKVDDNDGATTTQQLVITIQDINDNQVIFDPALSDDGTTLPDYTFTIAETDTAVGQVTASDIDKSAGEITYSLENPDGSPVTGFEIDQNGNIAVTDPNAIDVEADSANVQQTYVVRATSEDGSVSTQEININVQDVNDNPVTFDPAQNNDGSPAPNYMFTMAETEGVVGTITAQDADLTSGTITYSLENPDGSPLQGFTIDQNGEITVTDPTAVELDPDGANEFQSFVVRAQSEDGSQTTQTVQLTVEPINEHQLNFTDNTVQPVTIEETVNPEDGTRLVTQVEATDFDYTENVTYELLNHTDKFEIDSQTGEITVKQGVVLDNATEGALDPLGSAYETNGIYTLTEATMNESGAVWSNKTLDLTQDFTIKADLFFGSSPGGEGIAFILHAGAVDPSTTAGGSNLGANIDDAIVVEFDTNKDRSQDDPGFDHIAIHTDGDVSHETRPVQLFNIEDRDWHEATFNWDATNEIFTVSFEGRTATLSGDITQHLANNTEVNFGFTGTTAGRGNLQQVNILSIDGIDQVYDLEIQATSADTDPTTPSEIITTTVPVTITASPDVNVNDVIFDDPEAGDGNSVEDFTFTISETTNEVGTITANDADYRSGDITYSLENADGSPVNGFAIDEDGVITVTDPDAIDVDPDGANASQSFLVRAQSDDGSEATQEITINVQDINDNAVIFAPAEASDGTELPNYRFAITETDGVVGTVTANDNDYTSGNITYSLSKPDGSPAEGYAINSNGVITITDPDVVDIDPDGTNITQRLIVTAESEDGSTSAQPITIMVQDVNDNAVIFAPAEANNGSQLPNYAFTITEADAVVGTVAASDNDYSAGSISYSLENPDGSTAKGFAIDQDGNITVTDPTVIDLEADGSNALQNLIVRAVSEDGSINTQQISVAVQDVNEHPIIFDPAQNNDGSPASNFIFTMNETDGVVGTITAQDADVSSGNITYTLENQDGTPLEGFAIDEHGTITVTNPDAIELDPDGANELQNFVVRALSEDGSEQTQNVQLNIEPINEHALDFTDSTIQPVTIEETVNAEDGTRLVTQVEAKDFDYTENVTYELLNHTDKFEIDPQTGEITVKEGVILDNEGGSATFNALGTAYESNGIFTLTDPTYSQDGAIWSDQKLDLTQDFTITADLFLGSSNGADGITFVLHPDGFTPDDTTHGGSLGANISNAVVVEFDTYRNSDLGDPWHDHVSIHTDGDLRHGADHSQAIQTSNLEDGLWHEATFTWDASAEVFTVSFEGKTAVLTGGLSQHLGNSTTAHFGFTGTTGGLYNLQQVNVKSIEGLDITYDLQVQATSADADPDTPSEVVTTTVPVTVTASEDVNVNDVVFDGATNFDGSNADDFSFNVTETSDTIGTISASDADYRSGDISFSLETTNGEPVQGYAIDSNGVITVTDQSVLDVDPDGINSLQNIVVRATSDDGSESTQTITINVQDVDDNPVVFAPAEDSDGSPVANYTFTITETDTNIGTVTATDNDFTAGTITYSLETKDGNPVQGFAIDADGNISITDPTVVDIDPDGANALQNIVVRAEAEDGSVNTQEITINVQDVDDNPVVFAPAEDSDGSPVANYTFTITETDTNIGTVTATDNDVTAGTITYSLETKDGNPVQGFAIDADGNISITDPTVVDIDPDGANALQNIVVRAEAEDGSVNTQTITINVQDVNDNPVVFAPAEDSDGSPVANYTFTITETDTNIGTVTATDNDFTAGTITYSLETKDGNPVQGFAIDADGNISITDPTVVDIDPDGANALQNIVVRAEAEDGSVNTQEITINVQDVDDNPVVFAPAEDSDGSPVANYTFTITETDTNIGTVTATDNDVTAGTITYSLETKDGNPVQGFAIDADGNISITDPTVVDIDPDGANALQNIVVRAEAEDGSVNTQEITINVQDVDDNPVVFAPAEDSDGSPVANYTFTITETDTNIGTVTATDNDVTAGTITYSLETKDGNPVQGFAIDADGNISITDPTVVDIDPEGANALQNIVVRAEAEDGSVNTQTITINVQDVDDNPVVFAPAEDSDGSPVANYTFTITETDTNIGTVTATDNDVTAGTITYSLETKDGNPVQGFAIDADGNISITDPTVVDIDPDGANALQNIVVRAEAEDGSVNTQEITINVQDVDDNPVVFAPAEDSNGSPVANYTFTITETDTNIGTVTATDNDVTAGTITYSLETKDGNPVQGFAIDADGNISITDPTVVDIDPDGANALQNIVVRAEAEDGSVNTQEITINVQDVDDNPVVFAPAEDSDGSPVANYTFTITETDTNIGTVTATDSDVTAGTITYSLETKDGNPVQGFAIDADGNISITDPTVVDIDPDGANALQNIVVRAEAEDGSINTQEITINVQDVDDNPVVFAPAEDSDGSPVANYTFTITETDTNIGTVTATDNDVTAGTITYSLETKDGNPVQGFAIDADGNISITDPTVVDIDPDGANALQNIVVRAEAEDGSVNTQEITINVQDVNDNQVIFGTAENNDGSPANNYLFNITEEDTAVGRITASDNDVSAGDITYSLETTGGAPALGFAIDQNGVITVTDPSVVDITTGVTNVIKELVVKAQSGDGSESTQQISINIENLNSAPTVTGQVDLETMDEDTTITITKAQLLANASDLDNDQLSVLNLTTDSGALYDNNDGTWNFTPGKDFSGNIALSFEVSDGSISVPTGGILAVNAIADAPSLFIQVANIDAVLNDTADFSKAKEGVSFDLTDHDSQTVAGEADRWETDEVTGSRFDDTFSFDNLEAGETYTVHGGGGTNTIDLSNFTGNNVTIDHEAGTLTVQVDADGNTATINYDNISVVQFDSNVFDGTPHSVELDNHDWQINGTSIEVTSQGRNDWAVSPINFSGSLDENFTLNITVVAHDDGPWYNGAIVFDYQDANNYKMAVARIGADRWRIEQVENGRHTNVATTDYIRLDTNVPNVIDLEIEGSVATIFSNGVKQVSHDFGEPLNDGQIGVATNNSHTSFDINLRPSNWAPSVENYDVKIQVQDGGFTSQNVLADAFDPEGAELNVTGFTQAKHGAVVDNGDGTFSYTPVEGFVGVDSFTYSITDGENTTEGIITVDVQSDAAISILRGEGFVLDVGASLTDIDDSETLTVQLEGVPEGTTITDGTTTITVGANGIADVTSMHAAELLFTPPEDYNASFDVTVQAIATEPNGSTSVTSSSFDVVILNADTPTTGSIDILGDAEVGNLLTADISSLIDPDGDISTEYQWYRGAGDNKEAIDGATSNEYTLVEADANHQISVEVRAGDTEGIPVTFTDNTTFVAANPEFQGFTQSRELLLNGDFEDGAAHWTNDYGTVELQQIGSWIWGGSNDSGDGDKFAELSADNLLQNNLKQTVVVDSSSDSVTLKFDYKARLDGFGTQQFSVFLGSVLVAEDLVSNTQWQTFEITLPVSDLNLDESGELTLEFYEDTNLTVGVMLDDISLVENLQSTSSTIHIDNDISQDGILASLAEFDESSIYTLTNPDGSTSEDFAISDDGQLTALSSSADLPSGITELNLTITNAEGESSTTSIVLTKDTVDDIIYSSSDDFGGQPIVLDGNAINDETGVNDATDRFHIEGNEDVLIINFDATQGDTLDISSVLGGGNESIDLSASNIEEYVDISGDSGNFTIKVKSETQDTPEQVITIQDATGLEDQAALIQMLIQNN